MPLVFVRRLLTEQVAGFLREVFPYLRTRRTGGYAKTVSRIFAPIMADTTARLRSPADPPILVGHRSGIIRYEFLSDRAAVAKIETDNGSDLDIDAWITVGAQPGRVAEMGLSVTVSGTTPNGRRRFGAHQGPPAAFGVPAPCRSGLRARHFATSPTSCFATVRSFTPISQLSLSRRLGKRRRTI